MIDFNTYNSHDSEQDPADLSDQMAQLAQAYAKQKISRSSYRRQRKALLDFREGKLKRLPEFCFNERSVHQVDPAGDEAVQQGRWIWRWLRRNVAACLQLDWLPATLCLLFGGLLGVLIILVFD